MQRNVGRCIYVFMTFMTHGNVKFDIFEPHAFRKYSKCWVLKIFVEPWILKKFVHACVVNVIHAKLLPGSVLLKNIGHKKILTKLISDDHQHHVAIGRLCAQPYLNPANIFNILTLTLTFNNMTFHSIQTLNRSTYASPRAFYCTKMCEKSKSSTFLYYK